jgi:hypothetical protein
VALVRVYESASEPTWSTAAETADPPPESTRSDAEAGPVSERAGRGPAVRASAHASRLHVGMTASSRLVRGEPRDDMAPR